MKAVLLSAGYGKRLRPLTWFIPKCLVKVAGKPVIQLQIEKLRAAGINRIMVNVHHLPSKMLKIPKVLFSYEPKILGETETIMSLRYWLEGEPFIVINSDTLTEVDYAKMIEFAKDKDKPVLFWDKVYAGVSIYPKDYFKNPSKPAHPDWKGTIHYTTGDYWVDMGTWKGLKEAERHYKTGDK
jgi:NDP-sugar pyrophosphorylase family protein